MIAPLLLAGLTMLPLELDEEVLDVRVVDLDADGREEIVAVTATRLLVFRDPKRPPAVSRPAPPLTIVGYGLVGVVREGRYHAVKDPFGKWIEAPAAGPTSLLGKLGTGPPRLLMSPGDVDGDGKADAVLCSTQGFLSPAGLLPIRPEATLQFDHNENFAVEYRIPVPVAGNWTGGGRELVFLHQNAVISYSGTRQTDRLALPLSGHGKGAKSLRRNHVFLRDIDRDGRLDLVVVIASGSEGIFGDIEATAHVWLGGRIYNSAKQGFYGRAAFVKVNGALLAPALLDVDGDGDLDLVLSTVKTSLLASATGTATGTYHVFRFGNKTYERKPAWTYHGPVPMSTFTTRPIPPVTFLRDLDGTGRPKAIEIGTQVRLLEARGRNRFVELASSGFQAKGRPACGRRRAVLRGRKGLLVIE